MNQNTRRWRERLLDAIADNPVALADPEQVGRLRGCADDWEFESLGYDSLARMELCIWLETFAGVEVTEPDIAEQPSLNTLAAWLADRQG